MSHVHNIIRRSEPFVAGLVIGLSGITPVYAATLDGQLTPRNLVLAGSLVVLCVGIALKVMRTRNTSIGTGVEDPDLRWWLNPRTE